MDIGIWLMNWKWNHLGFAGSVLTTGKINKEYLVIPSYG